MRVLPMGPTACLIADLDNPVAWSLAFRMSGASGVVDVVPGADTVLITCTDELGLARATELAESVTEHASAEIVGDLVELPVVYDGPDLVDVASAIGRSVDDVIELHSSADYVVAFCGFAPGYSYLTGLPRALWLPRRDDPRVRVPAGSLAISAEYSAVYPRESPGGWHLIGSCDTPLFDLALDPPAVLVPGTRVKFVR